MQINTLLKSIIGNFALAAGLLLASCGSSESGNVATKPSGTAGKLQGELDKIKSFNANEFRGSTDALRLEVTRLDGWALVANAAETDPNKELKPIADQMKQELSKLQEKEYPAMRQAFIKLSQSKLASAGITADVAGAGNSTLELTSPAFTSKRLSAQTSDNMTGFLKSFRFKQVAFKLFKKEKPVRQYATGAAPDAQLGE